MTLHSDFSNAELFKNGTFLLGHAMKNHSGNYMLEEYGLGGQLMRKTILQLEIQGRFNKTEICVF